jgi:hypothetical protein
MDRLWNYRERCEEHDNACAANKIASDADSKEPLVRQEILNSFHRVVLDKQSVVDLRINVTRVPNVIR